MQYRDLSSACYINLIPVVDDYDEQVLKMYEFIIVSTLINVDEILKRTE